MKINSESLNEEKFVKIKNVNYKSLIEEFKTSKLTDVFGKDIQKMEKLTNENDNSDILNETNRHEFKPVNSLINNKEKEEEIFVKKSDKNFMIFLISIIIALIFLIIYMLRKIKKKIKQDDINRRKTFSKKNYELRIREYGHEI